MHTCNPRKATVSYFFTKKLFHTVFHPAPSSSLWETSVGMFSSVQDEDLSKPVSDVQGGLR